MHGLGVFCAIAASTWLGGAEAPTKLVSAGYSPVVISLCMIVGVFFARWTVPTLLKGTSYVLYDLRQKPHLMVWAVLAGAIWAVANTLTIVAVRDVGLAIAFPLWNINSSSDYFGVGSSSESCAAPVRKPGSASSAVPSLSWWAQWPCLTHQPAPESSPARHVVSGIGAALGAGILLGTMYIPYRKAYLSGLNPLSFVTIFTLGELTIIGIMAFTLHDAGSSTMDQLRVLKPSVLWLFLGGFCWVIGDLFQQYGTKYVGISRAIPLSNTNQLWGLLWGRSRLRRVHSLRPYHPGHHLLRVGAHDRRRSRHQHCRRRGRGAQLLYSGHHPRMRSLRNGYRSDHRGAAGRRISFQQSSWPPLVGLRDSYWRCGRLRLLCQPTARVPPLAINFGFATLLIGIMMLFLLVGGWILWKRTRFA